MKEHRTKIGIVFLIVFIDLVGFGIVIPILPLYAEEYGPSPVIFGLLMASFSIMQFIFAPILGRLSVDLESCPDRRPVLGRGGVRQARPRVAFPHRIGLYADGLRDGSGDALQASSTKGEYGLTRTPKKLPAICRDGLKSREAAAYPTSCS